MAKQKKEGKLRNSKSKANKSASKKLPKHLTLDPDLPTEHFGIDFFHFWNGDTYVGNYKATINKELTREGSGRYFTNDGSSYSGLWVNDELSDATKINFKDGACYTGHLLNGQYNGQGVYSVPGIGTFSCDFIDGKPLGDVLFDDIDNNKWQGDAENSGISLRPRNHFFYSEDVKSGEQQDITVTDSMEGAEGKEVKKTGNNVPMIHITEFV